MTRIPGVGSRTRIPVDATKETCDMLCFVVLALGKRPNRHPTLAGLAIRISRRALRGLGRAWHPINIRGAISNLNARLTREHMVESGLRLQSHHLQPQATICTALDPGHFHVSALLCSELSTRSRTAIRQEVQKLARPCRSWSATELHSAAWLLQASVAIV